MDDSKELPALLWHILVPPHEINVPSHCHLASTGIVLAGCPKHGWLLGITCTVMTYTGTAPRDQCSSHCHLASTGIVLAGYPKQLDDSKELAALLWHILVPPHEINVPSHCHLASTGIVLAGCPKHGWLLGITCTVMTYTGTAPRDLCFSHCHLASTGIVLAGCPKHGWLLGITCTVMTYTGTALRDQCSFTLLSS